MKRRWQVKVKWIPPFSMGGIEEGEDPEYVCRSIFGERFEWVR